MTYIKRRHWTFINFIELTKLCFINVWHKSVSHTIMSAFWIISLTANARAIGQSNASVRKRAWWESITCRRTHISVVNCEMSDNNTFRSRNCMGNCCITTFGRLLEVEMRAIQFVQSFHRFYTDSVSCIAVFDLQKQSVRNCKRRHNFSKTYAGDSSQSWVWQKRLHD